MPPKKQQNDDSDDSMESTKYAYGKFLNIEDIIVNRKYNITINPDDNGQFFCRKDREDIFVKNLQAQLDACEFRYDLHIEVSGAGRLHAHGEVWFTSPKHIKSFYINQLYTFLRHNNIKMDEKKSDKKVEEGWVAYKTKQDAYFSESHITSEDIVKRKQTLAVDTSYLHSFDKYLKD